MRRFTLVLVLAPLATAWGPRGHKQSAAHAYRLLSQSTFNVIPFEVGSASDDEKFVNSSVWADLPENDVTGAYHFVHTRTDSGGNCLPYDEAVDCGFSGSGECLVTGIMKYVSEVLDSSKSGSGSNPEPYMMLIHLMADLHQPMHVGFAKDHGGLDISLSFPEGYNLHELWDDYLVSIRPDSEGVAELFWIEKGRFASFWPESWDSSSISVVEIANAVKQWIITIVEEVSQLYTCPKAYMRDTNQWIISADALDEIYLSDRTVVANRLIKLSGVRLAVLLNRIGKYLNSMAKAERKLIYMSEAPKDEFIEPCSNSFAVLTIDDFDFIPDDLIYRDPVSEASEVSVPASVFFHGVPLSDVALYRLKRSKELYVTFRSKKRRTLYNDGNWYIYDMSFPLNPEYVGKDITLSVDGAIFEYAHENTVFKWEIVLAIIHHIRGVGVPKSFKQSHASKSLLTNSHPSIEPVQDGIFSKLPAIVIKNITPVSGNLYVGPHELTAFNVPFDFFVLPTKERAKQTAEKKALYEKVARAHAAKYAPNTINDPSAPLLRARYMFLLERQCDSIRGFVSSDRQMRFITSTSSLERSELKPMKPMMAHMIAINALGGESFIFVMDANLIDNVPDLDMMNLCFRCANLRKFNADVLLRPSIIAELDSIQSVIQKHDANLPKSSPIDQLMLYASYMYTGHRTVEWNLK